MTPFEMQKQLIEHELEMMGESDFNLPSNTEFHRVRERMYDIITKLELAHKQTITLTKDEDRK